MKNIDEVLLKYFQNNLSLEEQHKLSKWLEENENNEEILKKVKTYWQNYSQDYTKEKFAVEQKVFQEIEKDLPKRRRSKRYLYLSAVVIILLLGLTITFWYIQETTARTQEITQSKPFRIVEKSSLAGQKITTHLSDGTKVRLNSGSKLIVPEKFSNEMRSVELIGEAFFEVAKDESRPFEINTKDFTVKVLGTSFNVNAYSGTSNHVAVKEGIVSVKSDSYRSVELNKNQMVEILNDGDLSELHKVDEIMVFGWINQILSFEDHSIHQVFDRISLWYGVEIVLEKESLPGKLFTASFENPALKDLLVNVSKVYGFSYKIEGKKVIIK